MSSIVETLADRMAASTVEENRAGLRPIPQNSETELKLKAASADFPMILAGLQILAEVHGPAVTRLMESRYFDTNRYSLLRNGLTLRVRKTGDGYVQTIKTAPKGEHSAFQRGEWEASVPAFSPDLGLFTRGRRVALVGNLEPVFGTVIERQKCVVGFPKGGGSTSQIEIALDEGYVHSRNKVERIAEIELELVSGEPAHLFELGRNLHGLVDLRLGDESKAARGYRLAGAGGAEGVRGEKLVFDQGVSLDAGMERSFRACLGHWLANQAAVYDGSDPEGVHQMRVATRRFRSALTFFRRFMPPETEAKFRKGARDVADSLGEARDWDVFLEETLPPVVAANPGDESFLVLADAARRACDRGYEQARAMLDSPFYTSLVLELAGWIERGGWREYGKRKARARLAKPMLDLSCELLSKRYLRVREAGKGFKRLSSAERHQLRIVLKKQRYAGDFFRSLYSAKKVKPFRKPLTRLLDELGHSNDITVAAANANRLIQQAPSGQQRRALAQASEKLLDWHREQGRTGDDALLGYWKSFRGAEPYWLEDRLLSD